MSDNIQNLSIDCINRIWLWYEALTTTYSYLMVEKVSPKNSTDRFWFMYPIEETKERYRKKTLCFNANFQNLS